MRQTYRNMIQSMERFRKELQAHGAEGLSEKAREAVGAAANMAGKALKKAQAALVREGERVSQHEALMARARVELKAQLRQHGRTEDEAKALTEQIMAQCRFHERLRVRLVADLLNGAGSGDACKERAEVASRANSLCDAGFSEKGAGVMTRALLQGPGPHRERVRVMREVQGLFVKCKAGDRADLAEELQALTRVAQEKGLALKAMVQVMRQIRRAQRKGVPAALMAGYVKTELARLGQLGDVGASVQNSMKALQKLRSAMRKKASQYRDTMRKRAENASGKGAAGKGKGK
jgi:hypothetical protein